MANNQGAKGWNESNLKEQKSNKNTITPHSTDTKLVKHYCNTWIIWGFLLYKEMVLEYILIYSLEDRI